jgi:hypothetical protein
MIRHLSLPIYCCLHSSFPPASAGASSPCSLFISPNLSASTKRCQAWTHLLVKVILLVILVLEVILVFLKVFVSQCLAREVVNRAGDDLLLEVLSDLVVCLETSIELFKLILIDVISLEILGLGWLGWVEEVEERVVGDDLLDDTGSARGCKDQSPTGSSRR